MSLSTPRVLVLGGNPQPWSVGDPRGNSPIDNGIEAFVFAFGGEYRFGDDLKPQEVGEYDIIIGNTNHSCLPNHLRCLSAKPERTKWVTLIEGSASDYLSPIANIREVLDGADLVNVINKYSTEYFRLLTKTKVEYIGIPFPAEELRSFATPIDRRTKEVVVLPLATSRWADYFTTREMGLPFRMYDRRIKRTWKTMYSLIKVYGSFDKSAFKEHAKSKYGEPQLEVGEERGLIDFCREAGGAYFWLNLDPRYTWGRHVLNAAALRIPVISTRSTGHQEDFFPELLLETPFDVVRAIELGKRLVVDDEWYRAQCNIPIEKFEHLRADVIAKRIINAVQ